MDIDSDTLDELTVDNLKEMRESILESLVERKQDRGMAIFTTDKDEDIKQLKKLYKAFNRVINYMSVAGQYE